jgi:hypothetical protein
MQAISQEPNQATESGSNQIPMAHVTLPFRSLNRQPLAKLTILDDDGSGGETIAIRSSRLVIGRESGDVTIPLVLVRSGQH